MSNYYCQNCGERSITIFVRKASDFPRNCKGIQDRNIAVCQRCKDCFEENEKSLQEILSSDHKNKLILGGPGTGKTFLFKNVVEDLPENSNILVTTFINNLAEDLEKRLGKISKRTVEVRTLHSFCNSLLRKTHQYEYFPELPIIIKHDALLLDSAFKGKDFSRGFFNLEKEKEETKFYLSRSKYYNCVSHDDVVYRTFSHLNQNERAIPQYSQVIIDEYQDFNRLESSLIELIVQKNKIIIAGDDDQALYRFKSASPEFIRKLHQDQQFKNLFLPFCRRCTSVLIEAANAFISNAKKRELLKNRIKKEFKCYWPDRFSDSKKYSSIFLGKFSVDSVVSKYIAERVFSIIKEEEIQPSEKDEAEFLIVGPPRISHYLKDVNESLAKDRRVDPNIFKIEFKKESKTLSINQGYGFVKKNEESNLGWRIIMYKNPVDCSLEKDKEIIRKTLEGKSIVGLLPERYMNKHKERANSISLEEVKSTEDSLDKKIKIKLTTYLGAKGLSANHVFVLGLENGVFPKDPDNISNDEACQFLVLLTRARKSLSLLSVNRRFNRKLRRLSIDNLSFFVSMIPSQFLEIRDNIKASSFDNS